MHFLPITKVSLYKSDPIEVLEAYDQRGAGADIIGEVVQGGEAERFPCEEDACNAVYLALVSMGHNLDQAMKVVTDRMFRKSPGRVEEQMGPAEKNETGNHTDGQNKKGEPDLLASTNTRRPHNFWPEDGRRSRPTPTGCSSPFESSTSF